ncbi:MAG TPA: ester cyclase [Ferruginibacter sp.]|jgi:hypothetical protein|nr:ester cyclase [Ferruginibacter sp.]
MTAEQKNAETIKRYVSEIWNMADMSVIDELIHPDFNFILVFAHLTNKEDFKKMITVNHIVFQDLAYYIDDPVGDIVVDKTKGSCFWRMTGKHIGVWRNVPASNKEVSINGITFFKFTEDGKMIEARVLSDVFSLMNQIDGIKELYA